MSQNNENKENNESRSLINANSLVSFFLGIAAGLFICFMVNKDENSNPDIDISANLISNGDAIALINNFTGCDSTDNTVSGHLELDVLLSYINKMSNQCQSIGAEMSGLEYYFARYMNDPVNANRRTALFYPTYSDTIDGLVVHVPFDPFSSTRTDRIDVVRMSREAGLMNATIDAVMCVLDKSNMSPPRGATF